MAKGSAEEDALSVDHESRMARTAELVAQLHAVVEELEAMHPGRRFPLDGHLVGSIGEAAAETMFDIDLVAASTACHDAIAGGDRPSRSRRRTALAEWVYGGLPTVPTWRSLC